MDVSTLFSELSAHYSFPITCLKAEQSDVIDLILRKEDVFAFYPTGFGKSFMYILPPLMQDLVRKPRPSNEMTHVVNH